MTALDWQRELDEARALAESAIRIGEGVLDTLALTRPYVAAAAGSPDEDGDAVALLERIDKAIGPDRAAK